MDPAERSLQNRIAAHAMHAKHDPRAVTANARAASPGADAYWEKQVRDEFPDLDEPEVIRRAYHLKQAYFLRLSLLAKQAKTKAKASQRQG